MPGNSDFQVVDIRGWSGGLPNLLRVDFGKWFRTQRWWRQSLTWAAIINGIILLAPSNAQKTRDLPTELLMLTLFIGMFSLIAVVIMMQGVIVGERDAGTAAWVLSKPVTKTAFILSKLLPNLVGVFVSMILAPGLVAYLQFSYFAKALINPFNFLLGLGVLWIFIGYYLALTLMLGTLFSRRGPVIGIALAFGLGQQLLIGVSPLLQKILPWGLAIPYSDNSLPAAVEAMLGKPISDPVPLIITSLCLIAFVVIGIWKFNREEF